MARVLYAAEVQKDLRSIYGYGAHEWSTAQAAKYLRGLREKCGLLAGQPRMAPLTAPGIPLRVALYREHRILYRPVTGGIEVLRIVHQAQHFAAILDRLEAVREIVRRSESQRQTGPDPEESDR